LAYIDAVAMLIETPALARGCLLGVVRMECSEISPRLAAATGGAFDRWERALAALIEDAGAERGVELDATALAKAFLSGVEGGLLLDRRSTERRAARAAIDHFRAYLVFLLNEKGESE
jgi:Tetracyclin repressor-like, C-terminal domain